MIEVSGVKLVIEGVRDFVDGMNMSRKSYEDFRDAMKGGDKIDIAVGIAGTAAGGLTSIVGLVKSLSEGFKMLGFNMSPVRMAFDMLVPPIGVLDVGFQGLLKILGPIGNAVKNVMGFLFELGKGVYNIVAPAIKGLVGFFGELAKKILSVPLNILSGIGDMLKRIGEIALGVLVRDAIRAIFDGIKSAGEAALNAAANFQTLEIRLQGLLATEIARGTTVEQVTSTIVALTDAEKLRLINLQEGYAGLQQRVDDTSSAYERMVSKYGENSKQALELSVELTGLTNQLGSTAAAIELLNGEGGRLVTTTSSETIGTMNFANAMDIAKGKAEELLWWVRQIAIATPVDIQTITSTITLASSYGLGTDQAKAMTTALLDFTAGMGLSDVAMQKIIENFGQMIQQGKITGTELRDMGRGAFVPINDLLLMTAERLGMVGAESGVTAAQLNAFAKKKGLDPVITMMEAFVELSGERFPGAAERMSKTLAGVKDKIKDFIDMALGFNVLKPMLDIVTGKLSDFISMLAGDKMINAALQVIGTDLAAIIDNLMTNGPTMEDIITKIRDVLIAISNAVAKLRKGDFEGALKALGVKQEIIDKIFKFAETVRNMKDRVLEFISALKTGGWQAALASLGIPNTTILGIDNLRASLENLKAFWDENGARILGAILESVQRLFNIGAGEFGPGGAPVENAGIKSKKGMGPGGGGGFLQLSQDIKSFTENLDADAIIEKIGTITESIGGFITSVSEFLTTLNEVWDTTQEIFNTVLEVGSTIEGLFTTIFGNLDLIIAEFADNTPKVMQRMSDQLVGHSIIPDMLDDIKTAFTTTLADIRDNVIQVFIDWVIEQVELMMDAIVELIDLFNGVSTTDNGPSGLNNIPKGGGNSTVNNTTNVNVNASYSQTQSPVTVSHDVQAILGNLI